MKRNQAISGKKTSEKQVEASNQAAEVTGIKSVGCKARPLEPCKLPAGASQLSHCLEDNWPLYPTLKDQRPGDRAFTNGNKEVPLSWEVTFLGDKPLPPSGPKATGDLIQETHQEENSNWGPLILKNVLDISRARR